MRRVRVRRASNDPAESLPALGPRRAPNPVWHSMRQFAQDSGTAAVEFGLLAPVLAIMVLGISQVSAIVVGSSAMETASRAAIQYVLNGGSDMSVANAVGLQAWDNMPANGTLTATEYCTCDGVTSPCTQACPDGSAPYEYVSVVTTGELGGSVFYLNRTQTQTARIR